jgi:adenylosuccinate lyase
MTTLAEILDVLHREHGFSTLDLMHLRHKALMQEASQLVPSELLERLQREHGISTGMLSFLGTDKKFKDDDFRDLYIALGFPPVSFKDLRKNETRLETILRRGDAAEMTEGRYGRFTEDFRDISSEQAKVRGRMKFGIEYMIGVTDAFAEQGLTSDLFIPRAFTEPEKAALRRIYKEFSVRDYLVAKLIERRTDHDLVAANTTVLLRAQQSGFDERFIRALSHYALTSSDVDTNVESMNLMAAFGLYCGSVAKLLTVLDGRADRMRNMSMVAQTHGQDAQLDLMGHVYATHADQIIRDAEPLLEPWQLLADGKIGGAIGTLVDMRAGSPELRTRELYRHLIEDVCHLNFQESGLDQDSSHPNLKRIMSTIANINLAVLKVADDNWTYASRKLLSKLVEKGVSGSSVMNQKRNPFLTEGTLAALLYANMAIPAGMASIATYHTQGDLRRSLAKRELFHPLMLSVIGIERLVDDLKKYDPNPVNMELEIYRAGPAIASSAIQTYLKGRGVPEAYDRMKDVVMQDWVTEGDVRNFIDGLASEGRISPEIAAKVTQMVTCIADKNDYTQQWRRGDPERRKELMPLIVAANSDVKGRKVVLGDAPEDIDVMRARIPEAVRRLEAYKRSEV